MSKDNNIHQAVNKEHLTSKDDMLKMEDKIR